MPVTYFVLSASALLQRGTEACVFALITGAVATESSLGIRDNVTLVIFALTWLSGAIHRVMACRSGRLPALKLGRGHTEAAMVVVFGAAPWMLIGPLHTTYPSLAFWTPLPVPPMLYAIGLALAAGSIAEPFLWRASWNAHADVFSWQMYRRGLLRSLAILLISGSPVIALLCVLWLAVTLWHSHASYLPPLSLTNCTTDAYLSAPTASSAVLGGANLP